MLRGIVLLWRCRFTWRRGATLLARRVGSPWDAAAGDAGRGQGQAPQQAPRRRKCSGGGDQQRACARRRSTSVHACLGSAQVRTHAHMHSHTQARMHACTHACTHTCTHTHTSTHALIPTHACQPTCGLPSSLHCHRALPTPAAALPLSPPTLLAAAGGSSHALGFSRRGQRCVGIQQEGAAMRWGSAGRGRALNMPGRAGNATGHVEF
jgi:hypothetical protein